MVPRLTSRRNRSRYSESASSDSGCGSVGNRAGQLDDMRVQNVIGNIRKTSPRHSVEVQRSTSDIHHETWTVRIALRSESAKQRAFQAGVPRTIAMLDGSVADLESRRQLLGSPSKPVGRPFDGVGMHPAIRTVAEACTDSRHYAQVLFEAGKVLVNS